MAIRHLTLSSNLPTPAINKSGNVTLRYIGDIDWDVNETINQRVNNWLQRLVNGLVKSAATITESQKFRVYMTDGKPSIRTITATIQAIAATPDQSGKSKLHIPYDAPIGKSYLASHIHNQLNVTAKNMAVVSELARVDSELNKLHAAIKALVDKKDELERSKKTVKDHDILAHIGNRLAVALTTANGNVCRFVSSRNEMYCKVLQFAVNGIHKELPVSIYMVAEKVTKEHNVAATAATIPMPIIHVLNSVNVMVPISDLTPREISDLLR